jgi:hypothetical protein
MKLFVPVHMTIFFLSVQMSFPLKMTHSLPIALQYALHIAFSSSQHTLQCKAHVLFAFLVIMDCDAYKAGALSVLLTLVHNLV